MIKESKKGQKTRKINNIKSTPRNLKKNKNTKRNNENAQSRTNRINLKHNRSKLIVVRRTSGNEELYDEDKLAQTTSRTGVPFVMARDIAKTATKKIEANLGKVRKTKSSNTLTNQRSSKSLAKNRTIVTANQIKHIIAEELRKRNRRDIASSYEGKTIRNKDLEGKPSLDEKEPVIDIVAANKNRVLYDPSKQKGRMLIGR